MKEYHFIIKTTLCTCIEAKSEKEARELALEEFNSGDFLCDLSFQAEDIELNATA